MYSSIIVLDWKYRFDFRLLSDQIVHLSCWCDLMSVFTCRPMSETTTTNITLFSCWNQTQRESSTSGIIGVVLGSKVKVHYCHATLI